MKIFTVLLLVIESSVLVYSREPTYSQSSQPKDLESILRTERQSHSSNQYEVIGLGKQIPPQDTNGLDIVLQGGPQPQRSQDNTRLKDLLHWLSLAKTDAMSLTEYFESNRLRDGSLSPGDQLRTEFRRGRRGGGRRGGKRRRGRGKGRRGKDNRRRRKGRGSRYNGSSNSGGFISNLRRKRSTISAQKGQSYFNEYGVFKGLQPLPFNPEQIAKNVSVVGEFEEGKTLTSSDPAGDVVNLSLDGRNRKLEVVLSAEKIENNVNAIKETTGKDNSELSSVVQVMSLVSETGRNGRKTDSSREKRGNRRGNKDGKTDQMATEEVDLVLFGNNTSAAASPDNLSQARTRKTRKGKLGRGGRKEGRKEVKDITAVKEDGGRRSGRGGRRGGEGGGRRRGGRGEDNSVAYQATLAAVLSNSSDSSVGHPGPEVSAAAGERGRRRVGRGRRQRRALPKNRYPSMLGAFTVPKGKIFKWTRNLPGMNFVNEFAFSSTERNVVVMMSFDPKLPSLGFANGATLYDFTGQHGVVALRPRVSTSPCYLMETSQTFREIVDELSTRNSSSVTTNTVIGLDGSADPLTQEEQEALLQRTPSLRRQCRGRSIVRTKTFGMNPVAYSGATTDIKLLTLDNEVTLTVRAQPPDASKVSGGSIPSQLFRRWGRLRSVLGRGSGRLAQWIGQGRWMREQGRGQVVGQGRSLVRDQGRGDDGGQGMPQGMRVNDPGNRTVIVTPVPTQGQGVWAPESTGEK